MGDPVRHKVFISYHHADQLEAEAFAERFKGVFIARMVGVSDADGLETYVDSDKTDYVMRRIREKYLADSTVTIVLIGKCTWSRRYVDWEIASTLRNDPVNKRSGLMAVSLKSVAASDRRLPDRLSDNVDGEEGYARWWKYPTSDASLRSCIEIALAARDRKTPTNTRQLRKRNGACS